MYELKSKGEKAINGKMTPIKTYTNSLTGGECVVYWLRRDILKNDWWAFEDLFALPFVRQLAAKNVIDLYGHGLALDDIKIITANIKATLRSQDAEKYEKAYAKVLELENLSETMADPIKQCMGLCTVYLLFNDELPDAWNNAVVSAKMTAMAHDIDSQAFFLNWWTGVMRQSGQLLKGLSQIVSSADRLAPITSAPSN